MSGTASSRCRTPVLVPAIKEEPVGRMTLGIDIACRAAHQASLADEAGRFAWSGRKFRTAVADLERPWGSPPARAGLTVGMGPTRNAWGPLAARVRPPGAPPSMAPPRQATAPRAYFPQP